MRPPGPVAFLYARLSYDESKATCATCGNEWQHTRGVTATCPKCGHQQPYDSPISVDRQADKMRAWCRAKWEPEHMPTLVVVEELHSGGKDFHRRPEGSRIISSMQKGDFLVICRIARGWRSARDFHNTVEECDNKGVSIAVVDDAFDMSTAMGRFVINLCVSLAQLEREQASERTKEFIKHRRQGGFCSGNHVPFGQMATICQKTGRKIVVDNPDELRMAKWIYEMKYLKHVEWHTIYAIANRMGFVNRAGRPYTISSLRRIGQRSAELWESGKLNKISDNRT